MEQYANNPGTTLNGAINNSVTSLVVTDASTFSTSGNFRILIDAEILKVTAVSGTTFTIVRGQEGTTAVSHSNGAAIDEIITSAAIDAIRGDNVTTGTTASRPSNSLAGLLYLPNDGFKICYDSGSAWSCWGPIVPITAPPTSSWTWYDNTGTNVFTNSTTNGGIYLSSPATSTITNNNGVYYRSYPGSAFTLNVGFIMNTIVDSADTIGLKFGIAITDSANKIETFYITPLDNPMTLRLSTWASHVQGVAGTGTTVQNETLWQQPFNIFLQLQDDGTNRFWRTSVDGVNFNLFKSELNTTFLTATRIGLFIGASNEADSDSYGMNIFHWSGVA